MRGGGDLDNGRPMRYFFHVHDDLTAIDEEGADLPDPAAAKYYALAAARELICDEIRSGRVNLDHMIKIEDENGVHVGTIRFSDAVQIQP